MSNPGQSGGLQTIFSFFLGLMLTAFFGVGVYTFHPPPIVWEQRVQDLDHQEQALSAWRSSDEFTTAEREEVQALVVARNEAMDLAQEARMEWSRSTSIVLIVLATLAMVASLVGFDRLPVLNNGVLLGGVFTMVYGVGWIVVADASMTRFLVMTAALAMTLALGYARFVRSARAPVEVEVTMAVEGEAQAEYEARLRDLEERMNMAANALARRSDSGDLRAGDR